MKLSTIHTTLAQIRKERGISQFTIAAALNVEQAAVSHYENGRRGISLDLLERWLHLLDIEVTITPKGHEPMKALDAVKEDLAEFSELKLRRNYLIAEMRSMAAMRVLQEPRFQKKHPESGENLFRVHALHGSASVGIMETRFDHPSQKHLAVDYTARKVSVYKFTYVDSVKGRAFFSEDDFLSFESFFTPEMMEDRRRTVLRADVGSSEELEIVAPEGFTVRSLVEIQENQKCFTAVLDELALTEEYRAMNDELLQVESRLSELVEGNRLGNGQPNPAFVKWPDNDVEAVNVPLNDAERAWHWVEEGALWMRDGADELRD